MNQPTTYAPYSPETETTPPMTPAAEKLLLQIARDDKGAGVKFRWLARGRYAADSGPAYSQRTFYPLTARGLVDDGGDDNNPVQITEAGRAVVAEIKARQAAKPKRAKASAESPAALRLLRAVAAMPQPVLIHTGRQRTAWHLGRDGFSARADTYLALASAGYVQIDYGFSGRRDIHVTDAGRTRLERSA